MGKARFGQQTFCERCLDKLEPNGTCPNVHCQAEREPPVRTCPCCGTRLVPSRGVTFQAPAPPTSGPLWVVLVGAAVGGLVAMALWVLISGAG